MLRAIGLGLGLSVVVVSSAFAQGMCAPQPGCACVAPIAPGAPTGQLTDVQGDVKVAGPANFTPASTPFGLNSGYDILVGPGGRATVNFGPSCQGFSFQTAAHVSVAGSCACLRVDPAGTPPSRPSAATVVTAITVIGVGAAGALLHKDETPASP